MARLIVEAVSREYKSADAAWRLTLFVSVSRADDGAPVTGLALSAFRICSPLGELLDLELLEGREACWEPDDTEPAGCYALDVRRKWEGGGTPVQPWTKGEFYSFGIQVRRHDEASGTTDRGQTVIRVESLGQ